MTLNTAAFAHVPIPRSAEYAARNELAWLRTREDMYTRDNPADVYRSQSQGTKTSTCAGRNPYDPYRDRIVGARLQGDAKEAQRAVADYLATVPPTEREAKYKSIRESVQQSTPLRSGGSVSKQAQEGFMLWARRNLPAEEVQRIFALARNTAAQQREQASACESRE